MNGFITNVSIDGEVGPITKGVLDELINGLSVTQYDNGGTCTWTLLVDGPNNKAAARITATNLPSGDYCVGELQGVNNSTPAASPYEVSGTHDESGSSSVTTYYYSGSGRALMAAGYIHYADGNCTPWSSTEEF